MKKSFFDRLFGWLSPEEPSFPPPSPAPPTPPPGAGAARQVGDIAPADPAEPAEVSAPSAPTPETPTPLAFVKDDNQRYYGWKALQTDDIGLTYSYQPQFKLPLQVEVDSKEKPEPKPMVKAWLHEGKDRLAHVQRTERKYGVPIILVSQSVKDVLSHFQLPVHRFHLVALKPYRIDKIETPYYLLQLEHDTLRKQLAYPIPIKGLSKMAVGHDGFRRPVTVTKLPPLTSYTAIKKLQEEISNDPTNDWRAPEIVTEHFSLATSLDLYTYKDEIVISEPLRDALQRHFPAAVSFYELNLPPIQMDPGIYQQKVKQYANLQEEVRAVTYSYAPEIKQLYDRSEARLAKKFSIHEEAFGDDEFTELSRRLQLVLPESFKETYRLQPDLNGWEWEKIKHIFTLEDADWKEAEAIGAIAFAGNGCGDHLGLPLQKDSLFEAGTIVFYFDHEEGSCHELGELADMDSWKANI